MPSSRTTPTTLPGLPSSEPLPDWLPGQLRLAPGTAADYRELAPLHYRAGRPATFARIVTVRHDLPGRGNVLAAIGVLSWPTALSRPRSQVFDLADLGYGERIRWANANVRTISRVIVRPAYRGVGLARTVIRALIRSCDTPLVEASAAMGAFHPMFDRAGMTRVELEGCPPYFWSRCRETC